MRLNFKHHPFEQTTRSLYSCNFYSGSPTKILHIVHNTEFPMSTFASLESGSCLIADRGFDSVLSKLKGFYEPRKGAKIEVGKVFTLEWKGFVVRESLRCLSPLTFSLPDWPKPSPLLFYCLMPDNFTRQWRASGWERVNWAYLPVNFLNLFSPRPAKTFPFVILLSNARLFYSSRESLWVGEG